VIHSVTSLPSWKKKHDIGSPRLDTQHKEMLDAVYALHKAFQDGKDEHALGKMFQQLIKCTERHFAEEEQTMQAAGYPEFPKHKAEHDSLHQQVLDLQKRINAGKEVFNIEVIYFLRHWVMRHIINADKKYGTFLKHKGHGSGIDPV